MIEESALILKKDDSLVPYMKMIQNILLDQDYVNKPYLNTNQNQQYIRNLLMGESTNAFTILGSGDAVFQLLYNDILDITAADINCLQKFVFALKCAAIRTLKLSEYENFIIYREGISFLSKDIFNDVKDGFLEEEKLEKLFWEYIITKIPDDEKKMYLFKGGVDTLSIDIPRETLQFIRKNKQYFKLRDNLEKAKIKVCLGDAVDTLLQSDEKYDFIDLTNILLFVKQYSSEEEWALYLDKLKQVYKEILNDSRIMILDYQFGVDSKSLTINYNGTTEQLFYQIRNDLASCFDLQYDKVPAIPGVLPTKGNNDSIIYVKKR